MDIKTATVRNLRKVARIAADSRERDIIARKDPDFSDDMALVHSLRSLASKGKKSDLIAMLSTPLFCHISESVTSPWG